MPVEAFAGLIKTEEVEYRIVCFANGGAVTAGKLSKHRERKGQSAGNFHHAGAGLVSTQPQVRRIVEQERAQLFLAVDPQELQKHVVIAGDVKVAVTIIEDVRLDVISDFSIEGTHQRAVQLKVTHMVAEIKLTPSSF